MRPLLRIPYTEPLPLPKIIPSSANTASGAIAALVEFLTAPSSIPTSPSPYPSPPPRPHIASSQASSGPPNQRDPPSTTISAANASPSPPLIPSTFHTHGKTVLLTGAGISVASGLADYRGSNGTYTLNKSYRPIYFHEFCSSHEARKRYWARSFLGWTTLERAQPNRAHRAVGRLAELGIVGTCITQNVDSFHPLTHPHLPTLELHGALRTLTCLSCHSTYPRSTFQTHLSILNPSWSSFLSRILATGALDTENPAERHKRGLRTNPDGDVDVPGAEYQTFKYPACPVCVRDGAPVSSPHDRATVHTDSAGAWMPPPTTSTSTSTSTTMPTHPGILKPSVTMFGESLSAATKLSAETAIDTASRLLVIGSSLATYSAWRLVKRAKEAGTPIAVVNLGGVRGEAGFFSDLGHAGVEARRGVRCSVEAGEVLEGVLRELRA